MLLREDRGPVAVLTLNRPAKLNALSNELLGALVAALDAIERSKTGNKEDVLAALFATKDRQSVLGTYSIDENGDTTLSDMAVYTIKDNALAFDQVIKSATE